MTDHHLAIHVDWRKFLPLFIIAAGVLAYANSFSGGFVFDDGHIIVEGTRIRQLWPGWKNLVSHNRWLVNLSFAINYAISGLDHADYHTTNLAIHILAGLLLYGIVRRTLAVPLLAKRYDGSSHWLALAVAAIWVVHPLQTQSVTYIVQRSESLTGLFYLLVLYCVVRSATSRRKWPWYVCAVVSSVLGAGCKETIVTVPLLVIAYDRIFLATSFRNMLRKRWPLYAGLFGTWGLLVLIIVTTGKVSVVTAGFGYAQTTPLQYLLTQSEVIAHYLRLAVAPYPLCFDYRWPTASSILDVLPQGLLTVTMGGATLVALFKSPPLAFVGIWFFIMLAPTSSIMPIADNAAEHRMYLPLAAVIALLVLSAYELLTRTSQRLARTKIILISLLLAVLTTFTCMTLLRNADYNSRESIWRDTVQKQKDNPRAHLNFGSSLANLDRLDEAKKHIEHAVRLAPRYADARHRLGKLLLLLLYKFLRFCEFSL